MAINKIAAPLSTSPSVFAAPVVNQLLALVIDCNHGARISGGCVKKGSVFNIGGSFFCADSDTAISGTRGIDTIAVKFSVSGSAASAAYVSSINSATWNGAYQGYYDSDGNMYYREHLDGLYLSTGIMEYTLSRVSSITTGEYRTSKTGVNKISFEWSASQYSVGTIQLYLNGTSFGSAISIILSSGGKTTTVYDMLLESGDYIYTVFSQTGVSPGSATCKMSVRRDSDGIKYVIS